MKGVYKTKEGSKVEILDFDEANKIAMIQVNGTQNRWVDETEYSTWEKEDQDATQEPEGIGGVEEKQQIQADETEETGIEEIAEEKPSKKRTYKKKDK